MSPRAPWCNHAFLQSFQTIGTVCTRTPQTPLRLSWSSSPTGIRALQLRVRRGRIADRRSTDAPSRCEPPAKAPPAMQQATLYSDVRPVATCRSALQLSTNDATNQHNQSGLWSRSPRRQLRHVDDQSNSKAKSLPQWEHPTKMAMCSTLSLNDFVGPM